MDKKNLTTTQLFVLILIFMGISACSSPPKAVISASGYNWLEHIENFDHQNWLIKGKIAFLAKKRQSANLFWQHQQDNFEVKLTSFVGTSVLDIEGNSQQLKLTADGKDYYNYQAVDIIHRVTGFALSISEVNRWLTLNLPINDIIFDQQGLPVSYQPSEDWLVKYNKLSLIDGWLLPTQMTLITPKGKIKLQANNWTVKAKNL